MKPEEKLKNLLMDFNKHVSHELNDLVGWDWRKKISNLRKKVRKDGLVLKDQWVKINGKRFKEYWLEKEDIGIIEELSNIKKKFKKRIKIDNQMNLL